jgi:hypothetical protein
LGGITVEDRLFENISSVKMVLRFSILWFYTGLTSTIDWTLRKTFIESSGVLEESSSGVNFQVKLSRNHICTLTDAKKINNGW